MWNPPILNFAKGIGRYKEHMYMHTYVGALEVLYRKLQESETKNLTLVHLLDVFTKKYDSHKYSCIFTFLLRLKFSISQIITKFSFYSRSSRYWIRWCGLWTTWMLETKFLCHWCRMSEEREQMWST